MDNSIEFIFEPITEETIKKLESKLFLSLGDLKSVIDLIAVKCITDKDSRNIPLQIAVNYENKNGELQQYIFNTDNKKEP